MISGNNSTKKNTVDCFRFLYKPDSKAISSLMKKLISGIAPRLYTSNLEEDPSIIIKRNWYLILANLYPEAIINHRSALEFKPSPGGHIFVSYSNTEDIRLPTLFIHFLKPSGKKKVIVFESRPSIINTYDLKS